MENTDAALAQVVNSIHDLAVANGSGSVEIALIAKQADAIKTVILCSLGMVVLHVFSGGYR